MKTRLPIQIDSQPDETTCGPTSLHTVYGYYNDPITLQEVIQEVETLDDGGTLGVWLGCHALRRGYRATIYTYNLQVFDPTWFSLSAEEIVERLRQQLLFKTDAKLRVVSHAYIDFLQLGGRVRFTDLRGRLIRRFLRKNTPILTGLSATYLYGSAREYGPNLDFDDIRGEPSGHFVVLHGYDKAERKVLVADPLHSNPMGLGNMYEVDMDRLIGAILLGIITYDANLLIIRPRKEVA